MDHIVNLAQQTLICALIGNTDDLAGPHDSDTANDNEIDLTGLEIPLVEGAIVGPLLTRVHALITHVSYSLTIVTTSQSNIGQWQICRSPSAKLYLKECCMKVSIKPLELVMYENTRWGSWLMLLDRFIQLQPV
jgi:hypothetical protein